MSASAPERTLEYGVADQCPNDRNPIFFTAESYRPSSFLLSGRGRCQLMLPDQGTDDWRARPAGRLPGSTSGTPCGSPRGWWPAVESGASRPALDRTGRPSDGP